jgi:trigger factor
MSQTVETLAGLERRIQLKVPAADLEREVQQRLNKLARTLRMPGFRPGKVPMKMVVASYGAQVQAEVLNDKVGAAFDAAVNQNKLRVAGMPKVEPAKSEGEGGDLAFAATFEVFPKSSSRSSPASRSSAQRARSAIPKSTRQSRSCGASAPISRKRRGRRAATIA